ncbi:hypothetical protein YKD1_24340 [Yersinia pseudotuberculosis]|nr:ATP-binding protein [Yersinia similis]CFQ60288.1 transposase/IS protein [Yersinia similis]HDL7425681.1 ATP-binding protein [Yersinia enterocolitica]
MPDYQEQIASLEKELSALNSPPRVMPNTTVFTETKNCYLHGEFEMRTRKADMFNRVMSHTSCPGCTKDEIAKLKNLLLKESERRREFETVRLMELLGIPDRFKSVTLDNYQADNSEAVRCLKLCKAYVSKWPERLKQGGGLVMCGKPGTGKNHLAFAIAKQVIADHQSCARFTSALRIARNFKSTWSKTAEKTEAAVIEEYTYPDLLIIDEIGVQFGSDAEKMILFEIINNRYEDMKPTILISNLPKDELSAFIGERVIDRMNDGGGCTLAFTWDSYRSRAA